MAINFNEIKKRAIAKDENQVLQNGISNVEREYANISNKMDKGIFVTQEERNIAADTLKNAKNRLNRSKEFIGEESSSKISSFFDGVDSSLKKADNLFSQFNNETEYRNAFFQNKHSDKKTSKAVEGFINSKEYAALDDDEKKWLNSYKWQLASSDEIQKEITALGGEETKSKLSGLKQKLNKLTSNARGYQGNIAKFNKEKASLTTQIANLQNTVDEISALETLLSQKKNKEEFSKRWDDDKAKAVEASKQAKSNSIVSKIPAAQEILEQNNNSKKADAENNSYIAITEDEKYSQYMTGEELATYRWIWKNRGEKKAHSYMQDLITYELDERRANAEMEKAFNVASSSRGMGALASVGSVFDTLGSGVEYVKNLATGNADRRSILAARASGAREGTKENWNGVKGEKFWDFVYDTGMSGADSLAAAGISFVLPYAGEVILGASAAANTANDLLDRGVSGGNVILGSLTAGVLESVFEHVSIGQLKSFAPKNFAGLGFTKQGLKAAAKEIGKSVITNMSEEALTEFSNVVADNLINGELSSYATSIADKYSQGMSIEQAKAEATKEVGEQIARAAASGALMGFGFGAGGSIIGLSSSQISNAQKGNAILKDPTKIEALKTLASNSEFKDIAKEAESLTADSKPTQIGGVFNKLFEKNWEKSKSALETELMKKGATKYGTNSASGLAMRILKTATTPKGKGSTMAEGMLSANSIAGETYKAFVNEGKFGGSEVLALNEILTSPSKQKTIQGKIQSAKGDAAVSDNYIVEEAFNGFSDEVITDALRHSKKNDNSNVPIHVLGISKGSSLYKNLSAAGLVDNDGNVSVQAIKNEYDKRMGIRKKESTVTATYGKSVTEHLEKERPKSQKNKQKNKTWLQKALDNAKINSEARSDDDGSTNADILAGGRVSASGKGKNRVRTYGANTEIIRQFLGRLNQNKKNKARTLAAGDSAWLSKPDFEPAAQVGGGLRESFLRNIQRVVSNGFDSIGRILSPELQEKVSDTVFMEDDGTVFSFFHWSPNKFDEFKYGDGAFHCGTLMSAIATKERSDEKVDGYLKEMYVISKKPFIIEDVGRFGAYSVAVKLEEYGIIDHNDLLRISEMDGFFSDQYDAEANVYVRGILESLGYDSYLYQNIKEDPGSWSVGVFNADQIITIAENGVLKENCGVTEADSNDGSVFNLSDSEDTMADADVQNDNYAKEDKYWEAENENERKVSKGLFDKIKNLFSNNKDADSITSIGDIVKQIEKDFGVPVSTGKFKQKAYGIYKNKTEAIRTKVSNALPTIAHEIGHHMDKRYGLRKLATITEAIQVLKDSRPDFYASYKQSAIPAEAVAEFIRDYLADRTLAKNKYPNFFAEFESTLLASKEGKKDLENLKSIGDMINRYFVAEKQERARAAVKSRAEVKRGNLWSVSLKERFKSFLTNWVNRAEVLKDVSQEASDLYDYSLKTAVRAQNNLTGEYMTGIDGEMVKLLDENGKPLKDADGNDIYAPALTHLFEDIHTEEEQDSFVEYLIYKHGLEFLRDGKRVFADDTINNSEYMNERVKALEAENPHFKKMADDFYTWQRTFMYEYGVKSGLMTAETAKNLWNKYPCYVPFNRVVDNNRGGVKKGVANQKLNIRKAKGSGLDLYDPIESYALKVQEFMQAADRNAVMQEIANTVDQTDGFGYLLEKVPPQQAPVNVSAEGTKRTIAQVLNDNLNKANATALYDELDNAIGNLITDFQISFNQGANVVAVYRNGKQTYYQVHDENLLKALLGLNETEMNSFVKGVGQITRLFKALTTGGNAVWSLTSNSVRDFSSAYKYSVEKNPIKFTWDYIKAIGNVISQIRGEKGTSEYLKLYKALGGGYNSSLVNSKQLKLTVKNIINTDKTFPQRVLQKINLLQAIETFSDAIEQAPRLAEFKRVLEKTGDKQKALLAAENITVNFNRSGTTGKFIDQFLPYFNASVQGTAKYIDNLLHNHVFRTKTIVSGILKIALLFAWNMLAMDDDDNDEYEKLSAYKKNNFYNIYKGDGKFISIPKAKDTAYFDSIVERIFETAFKGDVDWAQEAQDFAAYTWLIFAPPMPDDVILGSTAIDLATNKDFKGTPIVSSAYEGLNPKSQYNENTTWIAYGIGQLFGWSPMKIDHVIDSNLGWLGLLNRSLLKRSGEKDWLLGVGTKTVTDNAYSTDILNHFYDNAEQASKDAKSSTKDGNAVAKDKQYNAAKSVISALNDYGKDDESEARTYRIMARDYADNFEKNTVGVVDERLISLYERTSEKEIFADKTFNREYSIDKVKYVMDSDAYLEYVDEYYSKVNELYNEILDMGVSDEMTVLMLTQAKQEVGDLLDDKYKAGDEKPDTNFSKNWRSSVVESMQGNIERKNKNEEVTDSEKRQYNNYLRNLK